MGTSSVMTPEGLAFYESHRDQLKVKVVNQTAQLKGIHTIIRDATCDRSDFVFQSDRLIRMVVEEALSFLPTVPKEVVTPTGSTYQGLQFQSKICAVSIPRSGDTMEQGVRQVIRDVRIGKILIQRDEETALPYLLYSKLPPDIANRIVLLCDPMLATGGSVITAIEVLEKNGVKPKDIIFANLFAAPEGIKALFEKFPDIRVVTTAIDDKLDDKKYIIPGCGDFGDRFYGSHN